jgi:hypothetical protein
MVAAEPRTDGVRSPFEPLREEVVAALLGLSECS